MTKQLHQPRQFVCFGTGLNKKTGNTISFKVPDKITDVGLENLRKNVKLHGVHLRDGMTFKDNSDDVLGGKSPMEIILTPHRITMHEATV